jgi:hypothetical protein
MRKIQKRVLMAIATVAIFSSVALADGDMGGGGLSGNPPGPPPVIVTTQANDDVNGGGNAPQTNGEYGIDWLLSTIGQLIGLGD